MCCEKQTLQASFLVLIPCGWRRINTNEGSVLQISMFGFSVVTQICNDLKEQIFIHKVGIDNLLLHQQKHTRHRCLWTLQPWLGINDMADEKKLEAPAFQQKQWFI